MNGSSGAFANRFGAGVSAGCSAAADDVAFWSFDLDRAGESLGAAAGVAEELRPRAVLLGAGATTTASVSGGLDPALSFFSAFPTDVVGARFGVGSGPAAAPDELDAAPGVREALLLLALAFAVGGCAEGPRLAARGFAALASAASAAMTRFGTEAALGTEAARGGATLSGIGVGFSFEYASLTSRAAVKLARILAILFLVRASCLILLSTTTGFLILPLPGGGGGPPGGGAMPAGVSGGPDGMCSINSLGLVFPTKRIRCPFAGLLTDIIFIAFPPLTLDITGVPPEPGSCGG